jgi:hypothetical protein
MRLPVWGHHHCWIERVQRFGCYNVRVLPCQRGGDRRRAAHPRRPGLTCEFGVEPPAGIEPATPSLPSMRRGFTTPGSTSRRHTTAHLKGAAKGWVLGRRQVTCRALSGESLARPLRALPCVVVLPRTPAPSSRQALDHMRLGHLRCTAIVPFSGCWRDRRGCGWAASHEGLAA